VKRFVLTSLMLVLPGYARAQQATAAPPATAAPAAVPTSRPSPEQLHRAAYPLLKDKQFAKAVPLLEQAYSGTPVDQRSRALVLNHAMLDLSQKAYVMRAVKDLSAYLGSEHPKADEPAADLLGAALDAAPDDDRVRDSDLYTGAQKVLKQCINALEASRPGQHKWGARWISGSEYSDLRAKNDAAQQAVRAEKKKAAALARNVEQAKDKQDKLADKGEAGRARAVRRREAELEDATRQLAQAEQAYNAQLAQVQRAKDALKQTPHPEWPTEFEPVDPDGPEALRPPKPRPAAPATAAAGGDAGAAGHSSKRHH